jgi:membrane protein DedA with SNARE-associated domain
VIAAVTSTSTGLDGLTHVGLIGLAVLIAAGSLVPVLPTGALVAAVAAVALRSDEPVLNLASVLLFAAAGAFAGDAVLYELGRLLGGPMLHRLASRADPERLATAQHGLGDHNLGVLVVSRLLPAGRIPVLVASVLVDLPWRRFLAGNAVAVVVWALSYMVVGTVGASIFPQVWEGVLAAVVLVSLISGGPMLWRRLRHRQPRSHHSADPSTCGTSGH